MRNKLIFALVAALVFSVAAYGGYVLTAPREKGARTEADKPEAIQNHADKVFTKPAVPKKQLENLTAQFAKLLVATEFQTLPDTEFEDTKGKLHKFSNYEGDYLLVNFWATWCTPCIVELPSLIKFADHYKGRIKVIAVALEQGKDRQKIIDFLKLYGFDPEIAGYADLTGKLAAGLGLRGIPTSFLIGRNGQIHYRFEGDADWMSAESRDFFDVFLLQNL